MAFNHRRADFLASKFWNFFHFSASLMNFIGAYMGDHREIHSKDRRLSKTVYFFQLETNRLRKIS